MELNAKQYRFTVRDIAKASGVSEWKVRRDIRIGRLLPPSIRGLSVYVVKHILEDKQEE